MELLQTLWTYFTKHFIEVVGLLIAYFSFFIPIKQYIDQRKLEEKDKRFTNYHKLIKELVDAEGVPKVDRQSAVVFELRNYPEYFEFTKRLLEGLLQSWSSGDSRVIYEIRLTISVINNTLNKTIIKSNEQYKPTTSLIILIAFGIFLIFLLLSFIFGTLLLLSKFDIRDFIANRYGYIVICAILSYTAVWLYSFKSRQQFWYGVIEVAFGFFSIARVTIRMKETVIIGGIDPFSIIGGISAAYLIIRGLSNASDGYSQSFRWKGKIVKYSQQRDSI